MNYDEVLKKLGEFGKFQKRIFFFLGFPCVSVGWLTMLVIVILYTPQHRCKLPNVNNDTFAVQSPEHEFWINSTIPHIDANDETLPYDRCHIYSTDGGTFDGNNRPINASLVKCSEWVFDKTVFYNTFTSQENYVCDNAMKKTHIQMLCFFGLLVCAAFFGYLSDKIGRKPAFYIGLQVMLGATIVLQFAPEFYSFAFLSFLIGGTSHGAFLVIAVLSMEIVGPTKRCWPGGLIEVYFAIGVCLLAFVSYLLRDWTWIVLASAVPCVPYIALWCLIPESPRWLLRKGRNKEAKAIITKAAAVNNVKVSEDYLEISEIQQEKQSTLWHLFTSRVMVGRLMILYFNWCIVSMTYYGVTMNAGNMTGNFFLNFFLMGLAEIPGCLLALVMMAKCGRRLSNSGAMVVGGLACLATVPTVLLGKERLMPLTIAFSFVGKAGAACAFATVYVFTAELLPTEVRNAGMGSASVAARIGGMLAPYIAASGDYIGGEYGKVAPLFIFGVLSVIAGLLLLLLPETFNKKLPESIREGIEFGRKQNVKVLDDDVEIPFVDKTKPENPTINESP